MAVSGADIMAYAKQFIGVPYVWGGNSLKSGVDCSGLVQQVYKNFGINVSRTTYTQIGEGKAVGMNGLMPGDMVFFDTNKDKPGVDHVGLYLGDGKMLHAPRPGKSVEISDITNGYYQAAFMGGRRVGGITGGGPSGDWDPSDTESPAAKLSPEELASQYGWAYSFLQATPELKKVFGEAVENTWTDDMFKAKLRGTKWWQENSETMRDAKVMKSTDPATYAASVNAARIQVQQLAAEIGASIPPSKLGKIAEDVIALGLDEGGLRNVLGQYVTFTEKGTLSGAAGMYEHSIKAYAYQQGVVMDNQSVKNQAQLIARGLATEQDFQNQIQGQAASLFPGYADQLKAGQTMMEIAQPYIQQMSSDLEIPNTQINLTDPLIKQALNGVDKDGKPTGVDVTTFQSIIRNDARWAKTQNAQEGAMKTGLKVLQDMGLTF